MAIYVSGHDPYVIGDWVFKWYPPGQDLRPQEWIDALVPGANGGEPTVPPDPFLISDRSAGRRVLFSSLLGASGPPYDMVTNEVPFLPGTRRKFINVDNSIVDLKLLITADSQKLLWAQMKSFPAIFQPQNGIGTLEIINPAGEIRQLNCTCISGFRMDTQSIQEKSVVVNLSFFANDPYWYSPWEAQDVTNLVVPSVARRSGFIPGLPSVPSRPNSVETRVSITNEGDVESFGVYIIQGPFANPFIVNQSISPQFANNKMLFDQNGGLFANDLRNPVMINTVTKEVLQVGVGPGTTNLSKVNKMRKDSYFFPIIPGENMIWVSLLSANANTKITLAHRSGYSTMI